MFLFLTALLAAVPVRAQPLCDAARLGSLTCQVGRMCECRQERGGSLTGREAGFRWDCGILRPACPPAQYAPVSPWPPGMPPPQLLLEREVPPWPRNPAP